MTNDCRVSSTCPCEGGRKDRRLPGLPGGPHYPIQLVPCGASLSVRRAAASMAVVLYGKLLFPLAVTPLSVSLPFA